MEQVKKLKVVIVCGFSNSLVREHLNLRQDRLLFKFLINFFKLPSRVGEYRDHAPWISNFINEFEKRSDIELHIITPHIGLKNSKTEFELNGIYYHFFSTEYTSFLRIIERLNIWLKLQNNSKKVAKIIKQIKPDIVNLVGLENPAVAVSVVDIKDIPVFGLCQTVYANPQRKELSIPKKLNWDLELKLFEQIKYLGVYGRMHRDLIKGYNSDSIIFDFQFPSQPLPKVSSCKKEFDFVNFALNLDLRKGAHDTVEALAIVKQKYPNVKLNFVGGCDDKSRNELNSLIEKYKLHDNIHFTPFFEKQEDMFQYIQKSKFAVLPCKMDVTSGTMSQSMHYGLPIVVYKTTGTPKFNLEKECALISEIGDIHSLAKNMLLLMENPDKTEQLRVNAREYISKANDNDSKMNRLIADYRAIIAHYNDNTPIPKELLFDINKFPIF